MKKIGILLPCFNERDNVEVIAKEIIELFENELTTYDYKIVFIDNASTDGTVQLLTKMCKNNKKIAAIFNVRNFNHYSSWYGIKNTPGDCVIQIPSDRQVPVKTISKMIEQWEEGHDFVGAIKTESREKRIMWYKRQLYYKVSDFFSDLEEPLNNVVATLYDRQILDECIRVNDPLMYTSLRIFMLKYCKSIAKVFVTQEKRKAGKSKNTRKDLVKIGMLRITANSNSIPVDMLLLGIMTFLFSLVALFTYIVYCIVGQNVSFSISAIILIVLGLIMGNFIILSGLMAEYILKINDRTASWPGVVEKCRINLD